MKASSYLLRGEAKLRQVRSFFSLMCHGWFKGVQIGAKPASVDKSRRGGCLAYHHVDMAGLEETETLRRGQRERGRLNPGEAIFILTMWTRSLCDNVF